MKKLKLFFAACALLLGVSNANAREDVTSTYLTDADLSSLTGWGNPGKTDWKTDGAVNVVEFWNWSNQFSFTQTAKLPAGYYRLAVNAFYRNSWGGDGTNNNMAWILAGEKKQNVVALNSMSDLSGYAGSNDLYRAATAFSQGKFSNEFDFNVTGEGTTDVEIGFKGTCPNGGWCILGPVKLYQYTAADYMEDYRTKVATAEALYNVPMFAGDLTALKNAVVEESSLVTVDDVLNAVSTLNAAINAANNSIAAYAAAVAPFNTLKSQAQEILAVESTASSEVYDALANAISTQQTVVDNAANAADITAAISALRAAVKTYVNNAEPKNEGEYFDITCLMANPDFSDNTITGWTKVSDLNPNTRIQCNEFYGKASFDFYQIVEGLPNGSYTLSMKAFQRPGSYDAVYADWAKKINKTTAQVYVNNDASTVMNIMEEMNDTRIYTDPAGEDKFNSDKQPSGAPGFIPNSMEGASAWFAAGKYQKTVAALVESGSLRLGFKDAAHDSDVWTLFDEFRLRYYGSSKLVYYQQYLPQLRTEVSEDLGNGAYANVLVSSEDEALDAALVATPASETEEAYETVINNLKDAQAAFRAAAPSYDAMVAAKAYAALTEITANIGSNVFQYPTTTPTLWSTYSSAKSAVDSYTQSTSSTAAGAQALVDALDEAKANYEGITLNAPDADKHYNIIIATIGHAKEGNAVVESLGLTGELNPTGYSFNASATPNANLAQAVKFTQVSGNTYNISFETSEGVVYLTYGSLNGSTAGWATQQIQGTTDPEKKGEFKIVASSTDNVFNIYNTVYNDYIDCQAGGSMYTDTNIDFKDFTIAEASQATVNVAISSSVKYATRIFPFAPELPSGVKAYSCEASVGAELTLVEVANPAANTPYILEALEGCASTDLKGWGTAGATSNTAGWLTGVYVQTDAPVGSYVLQNNNDKVAFYVVEEGKQPKVGANRCYLTIPAPSAREAFFFPGSVTGINAVNAIEALTSGKAQIFNASGAQIPALQKGLNIIRMEDGTTQKVVVK